MTHIDDAKAMAKRLRAALAARDITVPHTAALEIVAQELGFADWNTAAARLPTDTTTPGMIALKPAVPILRIFDESKAREFYCGFLGLAVDFEHRFEPGLPLYMGLSRGALVLHLSEHHGDASPGATVHVKMTGLAALNRELNGKGYKYGRPGIVSQAWGEEMTVHDPFGNRLRFVEPPAT